MIRINLLPYREKEKKENLKRQLTIIAASFTVFLLLLVSFQIYISTSISNLEKEVKDREERLVVLTKVIGDIEAFKADKKDLEKKLDIIKTLEENRLVPVRMLDELTTLVPTKDLWLEKFSEKGKDLRIEGVARDNIAVARFMKNLELSNYIKSVDLISSRQTEISGIKLQQFILTCALR
ncbi:MAG: PilN domain-containing protein [Syntrophales bacterium]|nr:PilN domain-containing protein [Syntrophales bacterium]